MENAMTSAVTTSVSGRRAHNVLALQSAIRNPQSAIVALFLALLLIGGCVPRPRIVPAEFRKPIDRSVVEFPAGMQFERFITDLTAPTAMAFDAQRNALLIAESGIDGREPQILGFNLTDGTKFVVYPQGKGLFGLRSIPFRMYGPIGGMTVRDGMIYVSHRDAKDMGVISALGYDGRGKTVIAELPAQGEYGVTDVTFGPDGRLYFGVGTATNSGVVGLDDWDVGWVQRHPNLADKLYAPDPNYPARLRGSKYFTNNPRAGLFTGSELAITAPFQPFGSFYRSRIDGAPHNKPNAAIYSVLPSGGIDNDLRVVAHGIRHPGGLAFHPRSDLLYASNQGMEHRGSRPVKNDPNTILKILSGPKFFGWPDFSADLQPITEDQFKPDEQLTRPTGNLELTLLLDHVRDFFPPTETDRDEFVKAILPPLSGAAKMTFLPDSGPFEGFRHQLIVALSGDRAPFATSGRKLKGPVGYKVVRVDVADDSKSAHDFIRNTSGMPRSMAAKNNPDMLERPIDVKIGPDGYLYVLDFGPLDPRGGNNRIKDGAGQVFRLRPIAEPTTQPAADAGQ
jgi:glucose/arabinose dehydrogenase